MEKVGIIKRFGIPNAAIGEVLSPYYLLQCLLFTHLMTKYFTRLELSPSFQFQASLPQPCAVLYDSTSCAGVDQIYAIAILHFVVSFLNLTINQGGWRMELPDGATKTFKGLILSANWFMR